MDPQLQEDIVNTVKKELETSGACSIKQAAEKVFYPNITMAEQRHLAKLVVKGSSFVSESTKTEIIIKKNDVYTGKEDKGTTLRFQILYSSIIVITVYIIKEVIRWATNR